MDELEFYNGQRTGEEIDMLAASSEIGIVVNGNQSALGASVGQFVIVRNSTISGVSDGLYTAVQTIPANTAIDGTYLTAVSGGGLNALNEKCAKIKYLAVSGTTDSNGNVLLDIPLSGNIVLSFTKTDLSSSAGPDGVYSIFYNGSRWYVHVATWSGAAIANSAIQGRAYYANYNN